MKKILLLLIIPLMFSGCNNLLEDEKTISIVLNERDNNRSLPSVENIALIELWISDVGVDYKLVEDPIELQYLVTEENIAQDLDTTVVRYVRIEDSSSISFDVHLDVQKVFSIRVVFDPESASRPGRVFMGSTTRIIYPETPTISIDITETSTSKQIEWFSELDEFMDEEW